MKKILQRYKIQLYALSLLIVTLLFAKIYVPHLVLSNVNTILAEDGVALTASSGFLSYLPSPNIEYNNVQMRINGDVIAKSPSIRVASPWTSLSSQNILSETIDFNFRGWSSIKFERVSGLFSSGKITASSDVVFKYKSYSVHGSADVAEGTARADIAMSNGFKSSIDLTGGNSRHFRATVFSPDIGSAIIAPDSYISILSKYVATGSGPLKAEIEGDIPGGSPDSETVIASVYLGAGAISATASINNAYSQPSATIHLEAKAANPDNLYKFIDRTSFNFQNLPKVGSVEFVADIATTPSTIDILNFKYSLGSDTDWMEASGSAINITSNPTLAIHVDGGASTVGALMNMGHISAPQKFVPLSLGPVRFSGDIAGSGTSFEASNVAASFGSDPDYAILRGSVSGIPSSPTLAVDIDGRASTVGALTDMAGDFVPRKSFWGRDAGPIKIAATIRGELISPEIPSIHAYLGDGKINGVRIDGEILSNSEYRLLIEGLGGNIAALLPSAPPAIAAGTFKIKAALLSENSLFRISSAEASVSSRLISFSTRGSLNNGELGGQLDGSISVEDKAVIRLIAGDAARIDAANAQFNLEGLRGVDPIDEVSKNGILSYLFKSVSGAVKFNASASDGIIRAVQGRIALRNGEVQVPSMEAYINQGGMVNVSGVVRKSYDDIFSLAGDLRINDVSLSNLTSGNLVGRANLETTLTSEGHINSLIKNLKGMGRANLNSSLSVDAINGAISQKMLSKGAPKDVIPRLPYYEASIGCSSLPFIVDGGVIRAGRWVLGTNSLLLNTSGYFDLSDLSYSINSEVAVGRDWRSLRGSIMVSGNILGEPNTNESGFKEYVTDLVIAKRLAETRDDDSGGFWGAVKNVAGSVGCGLMACKPPNAREGMYECR